MEYKYFKENVKNKKVKKVRVTSMYIIAVDINVSNRVVDINFTACKIMLNTIVKKYNDCKFFQLITLKKTRN